MREDTFVTRIDSVAGLLQPRCRHRLPALVIAAAMLALHVGCGYSLRNPYDTNIKTVFVPVAISNTFSRDLNLQLTELVQKEIMHRTPYKVVGNFENADTILEMKVQYADKNLVVENPTNLPLELNGTINIMAKWTHNPPTEAEKTRAPTMIMETINFIPQIGESRLAGFYRINQSLAAQIVDMMEKPWYTENDFK